MELFKFNDEFLNNYSEDNIKLIIRYLCNSQYDLYIIFKKSLEFKEIKQGGLYPIECFPPNIKIDERKLTDSFNYNPEYYNKLQQIGDLFNVQYNKLLQGILINNSERLFNYYIENYIFDNRKLTDYNQDECNKFIRENETNGLQGYLYKKSDKPTNINLIHNDVLKYIIKNSNQAQIIEKMKNKQPPATPPQQQSAASVASSSLSPAAPAASAAASVASSPSASSESTVDDITEKDIIGSWSTNTNSSSLTQKEET